MVWDAGTLLGCRLGGGGVEAAVELKRVAPDDLPAEALRQLDGQAGFSGSGGTQDDEELQIISPGRRK
jgi:hypothetical protein